MFRIHCYVHQVPVVTKVHQAEKDEANWGLIQCITNDLMASQRYATPRDNV